MPRWKQMVAALATTHSAHGFGMADSKGAAFLVPPPGWAMENRTPDEEVFSFKGTTIPRKQVRGWIWKNREVVRDGEEAVLWSVYDADEDMSAVGLSVLIKEEAKETADVG